MFPAGAVQIIDALGIPIALVILCADTLTTSPIWATPVAPYLDQVNHLNQDESSLVTNAA